MLDWTHQDKDDALSPMMDEGQPLHVLVPATHPGTNVCKTVMGLGVLGYPEPVVLAWEKGYEAGKEQIGSKVTEALNYVRTLENDNDLVMMIDAFDSWVQLPPDVLRARYFRLVETASYRMRRRMGRRAVRREALKQTIFFGARKTCSPNQLSSIACYPIPEATTARDMYLEHTDTIMGVNKHTSFRPRYLDAGFMMGPVGDVRRMLERAEQMKEDLPTANILSDGHPQNAANLWEGDAQGLFARIFGEQAFQREIIRRRYRSWFKKWSVPKTPGSIVGYKYDDITNPHFTHEEMKPMKGHPRESGISLDFSGLLVSNTMHSERDHRNMFLDGRPQADFDKSFQDGRNVFDCPVRISSSLPSDLESAPVPDGIDNHKSWAEIKLFGNLCLGNVPAVLHHNGDKGLREAAWPDVWWQHRLRERLEINQKEGIGAWDGASTKWMTWHQLCPRDADSEIFREG